MGFLFIIFCRKFILFGFWHNIPTTATTVRILKEVDLIGERTKTKKLRANQETKGHTDQNQNLAYCLKLKKKKKKVMQKL